MAIKLFVCQDKTVMDNVSGRTVPSVYMKGLYERIVRQALASEPEDELRF